MHSAWEHGDQPDKMIGIFRENLGRLSGETVFIFEYANALECLGMEGNAIPEYRKAIMTGLSGEWLLKAQIQLGSSLSVTGDPAALAFLCIALHRSGGSGRALRLSLEHFLAQGTGLLQNYSRALTHYTGKIS